MANARKCDLCERCFDPLNESGYMARFRNPVFQTANDIREGVRGFLLLEDEAPDAIVDLCPKCSLGFLSFMHLSQDKNKQENPGEETPKSVAEDITRRIDRFLRFTGPFTGGDSDGD